MKQFLSRALRNRNVCTGGGILVFVGLVVVIGPLLETIDPFAQSYMDLYLPPGSAYSEGGTAWLGTDGLGRDLFSRILAGGRITVLSGSLSVTIALLAGTLIGAISGYAGGWTDAIAMRLMDLLLAFPSILLAILFVAMLGPDLRNAVLAVAFVAMPQYARLMRAVVREEAVKEYVQAARALGARNGRILFRAILPNTMGPLIVQGTLGLAVCILDTSGLSFLGLGARPPSPEWGALLYDGITAFRKAPWLVIFPGCGIFLTVLGINLLGDGLRAVLDPRLRIR